MMGLGLIRNLVLPGTLASQQLSFGIKNIFIFQQRERSSIRFRFGIVPNWQIYFLILLHDLLRGG
jgi:hypothetical protein